MSDAKYCKDCKNMNCPENRVNCKYPDAIACDLYRDTQQTVFEAITQSRRCWLHIVSAQNPVLTATHSIITLP